MHNALGNPKGTFLADYLVYNCRANDMLYFMHPERIGADKLKDTCINAILTIDVNKTKKISDHLFGIFFEDLNYAADGGLYAELIQNRSFEYSPDDRSGWHPFTAWEYTKRGYGYGTISVETNFPININNPHYVVLNVEEEGQQGVGLINSGFDGIVIRASEKYDFSAFMRQISDKPIPFEIKLLSKNGDICGEAAFTTDSKDWKKYTATITATQSNDSCSFVILAKGKGKLALDVISLIPQKTFKNRSNGLRADLAQVIADLKPKFMRFPGGCLVHGDGLGNMYRWKNTVGPIEQRMEQRNIWNYHQSVGLGYFEYFQFCEDIGAKPLPVVPAAVSCQNSGGTWSIGSTGQKGLPLDEMQDYIQEILDLIEYANGPATSTWGSKRSEAGHPQPFNLEYIGIGNEDKQTPEFRERFKMIYEAIKAKHPEITIIGTVGPDPAGEDYEKGWKFANENRVDMVDEHYYKEPEWFFENLNRYDTYDRNASRVYVGEYAAHDVKRQNTLRSALAEAAYMTSLERNGDEARMASYAPLLAKEGHMQWNPDLIYFNNKEVKPSINYYVQQLYGENAGDEYISTNLILSDSSKAAAKQVPVSVVKDSKSGDLIIKLINVLPSFVKAKIKLKGVESMNSNAIKTVLTGMPGDIKLIPQTSACKVDKEFSCELPAYSFTVIRVKTNKKI
jgi:alpha-L-arabinofuranosidase